MLDMITAFFEHPDFAPAFKTFLKSFLLAMGAFVSIILLAFIWHEIGMLLSSDYLLGHDYRDDMNIWAVLISLGGWLITVGTAMFTIINYLAKKGIIK